MVLVALGARLAMARAALGARLAMARVALVVVTNLLI